MIEKSSKIKLINILKQKKAIYSLLDLINDFPDKKWDFYGLAYNPNIKTSDKISDKRFFTNFIINSNTTISDIKKNPTYLFWGTYFLLSYEDFHLKEKDMDFLHNFLLDKKWRFQAYYSISIKITNIEKIKKFPNFNWDIKGVMQNSNLKKKELKTLMYLPLFSQNKFYVLSFLEEIFDIDFLKKTKHENWDWFELSKKVHLNDILNNPDLLWDSGGLSLNPTVFSERLDKTKNILNIESLDSVLISVNESLTIEILQNETDINWDWGKITLSRFKITEILENKNLPWKWELLPERDDYTYEIYEKIHKEIPYFSFKNKNIKIEHIKKIPFFDSVDVSYNENLRLKDIAENPHFSWNFNLLSKTLHVSLQEIIYYKNLNLIFPWNWEILSENIKVSPLEVKENINDFPWNFEGLSKNKFYMDDFIFKRDVITIVKSERKIKFDILKSFFSNDILKVLLRYVI